MYAFLGYTTTYDERKSYGKWNFFIFLTAVMSGVAVLIMAVGAYLKTRKRDGAMDKAAEFVNL